jgi:hypothetical protein
LAEIYLCRACSCHEVEDGNGRAQAAALCIQCGWRARLARLRAAKARRQRAAREAELNAALSAQLQVRSARPRVAEGAADD